MSEGWSRRRVLVGLGAAGGVSIVGLTGSATAAPLRRAADAGGFPPIPPGVSPGARAGRASADALTAGLTYRLLDMTTWNSVGDGNFRQINESGVSVTPQGGGPLVASVDPPIGSVLKEVAVWYLPGADPASLALVKKPLDAPVAVDDMGNPTPVAAINPLPIGDGTLQATLAVNETIDGTGSYPLLFFPSTDTQAVAAIRYGYLAPPQAFIANTPIPRILDTRVSGGKLKANEERVINLGVPPIARAGVINLTVTETEQGGFVAVFPANSVWPGNSNINWATTGQNFANSVITATDAQGAIRMRGGVNATHVVIDVQGYLL